MSRRSNGGDRRKLGLKRETLRKLSPDQLGRVAGGTSWDCETVACFETLGCDTTDCWYSTGSRFC